MPIFLDLDSATGSSFLSCHMQPLVLGLLLQSDTLSIFLFDLKLHLYCVDFTLTNVRENFGFLLGQPTQMRPRILASLLLNCCSILY